MNKKKQLPRRRLQEPPQDKDEFNWNWIPFGVIVGAIIVSIVAPYFR